MVTVPFKIEAPETLRNPCKSDPPVTKIEPVVIPALKIDAPVTVKELSR